MDCPLFSKLKVLKVLDLQDRVSWILSVGAESCALQFLIMAWLIWGERNLIVHGDYRSPADYFWQKVGCLLKDFSEAAVRKGHVLPKSSQVARWKLPDGDVYKLNGDASLDVAGNRFGIGVVVKDAHGVPCLTTAISGSRCATVEIAEAEALEEGIKLAISYGLLPLTMESDASNVVALCNNSLRSRAEMDNIIQDILLLYNGFGLDPISFVPCCYNKVAHVLARKP
ncbi:hypothetical protein ACOSQ4_021104 [Xanthoceras sorbifolium]